MVPRRRRWVGVAAGGIAVGLLVATLLFPHTDPLVIHAKVSLIGPRLVYGPLAADDSRWEVVLTGVETGQVAWLRVAADLRPALDTHPGEQMLGAVARVLDVNPLGAIETLLPIYGPDVVCGQDEEGTPLTGPRAERRIRSLGSLGLPRVGPCLDALRHAPVGRQAG